MKGKLYIFGIGGTGSRVIKSLIMLASTGVNIEADAIVPIIVDPDLSNKDVTRTIERIKTYASIREKLNFNDATKNRFFKTNIENTVNDYRLRLTNTKNKTFKEFIDFSDLSRENKAFASMLFSYNNLISNMDEGFKGNPNIGSVVLNQFTESQDFINFAQAFKPGDRIFIISSIFGGTGASGFPLLLKNIRGLTDNFPNSNAIKKAPVGAITVFPYFDVKVDPNSAIDSSTFIGKTKAALHYYQDNVNGDNSSVNAMYYLGDTKTKQYENAEGGEFQRNDAHFVELAAALSIIDFASIQDSSSTLNCAADSFAGIFAPNPVYKEFGIELKTEDENKQILFENLGQKSRNILCKPMTQFVLMSKYFSEHRPKAKSQPWAKDNQFDDTFYKGEFASKINEHINYYMEWLREMSGNERAFKPFQLDVSGPNIFTIVDGVAPRPIKALWAFNKSGYDLMDAALNEKHTSLSKNLTIEQKFIELFYVITDLLVENKFRF